VQTMVNLKKFIDRLEKSRTIGSAQIAAETGDVRFLRIPDENGQHSGGKTATVPLGKRPVHKERIVAG